MNIEGRVIQTTKCHNPLGDAKEEWKVFRVLSDLLNKDLKFNNLQELRKNISIDHKQFLNLFELITNKNITFGSNKIFNDRIIKEMNICITK